jgi:two-component system, chemotaxis family, protein-glutamate methylesterase/glutaminase
MLFGTLLQPGMSVTKKRLLIVDDSAFNRMLLAGVFEGHPTIEVVAAARDGEEGLRLFVELMPDLVSLDLEMPKMDGFTCLRLMLAKRVVPIVVVSSYARGENLVRALELGAFDCLTKESATIAADADALRALYKDKILQAAEVDVAALRMRSGRHSVTNGGSPKVNHPVRRVACWQ